MKMVMSVSIILCLIFISCSNHKTGDLKVSNHDAYAFPVENGWEVNTSVVVKGIQQEKKNNEYTAKLAYTVDLVKGNGDTIKSIASDNVDEVKTEEITDVPVEAQVVLDSTYNAGKYKIIFNIVDKLSSNKISSVKEFELE